MERMSTLDAEFLHLEDGIGHMHIGAVCVFGDPPPSFDEVAAMIAAKLHLIPRYRQRVRSVPFELGRPVWVDDPHFNLEYHLRHTALPAPGDDAAFCRLMGRIMSQPLDRDRPLWETWLVEGLEGGRWALVFKIHHCMVDGIAGIELLRVMLDLEADATGGGAPSLGNLDPNLAARPMVLDAWGGLATDVLATARGLPRAITHPMNAIRSAVGTARGLARFAGDLGCHPTAVDRGQHRPPPRLGAVVGEPWRRPEDPLGVRRHDQRRRARRGQRRLPGAAPLARRGRRSGTGPLHGAGVDTARRRPRPCPTTGSRSCSTTCRCRSPTRSNASGSSTSR